MLLVVLPVGFFLAGLAIGRWWVVLVALATWGVLAGFLYVNDGWHGAGWGDFGIAFNVMAAVATVIGSVVGVGARRLLGFGRTEPGEIV